MKRGIFVLVSLILLVSLVDASYTRYKDAEINGTTDGLLMGYSLSSGDFNNDSIDDLIIGKYSDNGDVYLIFGNLLNGIPSQTVDDADVTFSNAAGFNSKFGRCVMIMDFNNDSVDDVVIAAPKTDLMGGGATSGSIYIYYGDSSITTGRNFGASEWNVSIEGVINPLSSNYLCNDNNEMDYGDLNNDLINDIVVSNYNADVDEILGTNEGQVYVFFGFNDPTRTDYTLSVSNDANITINGSSFLNSNPEGLSAVDVIPDTNGDGIDDLLIGGDGTYSAFASSGGAAYIFFGEDNSAGFNYQANNSANVTFNGDTMNQIGVQVAGGDFNNDGLSDIAIGSLNGSAWEGGQVGLFYSSPNWVSNGITYNFRNANLTINGSYSEVITDNRGVLSVTVQNPEYLGSDRMKILDINNDSIQDLVINSLDARPYDNYGLTYDLPSIYSVYGNTDNNLMSMLSNETNLTISSHHEYGNNGADNFGIDFVNIDANNDTTQELAIGVDYAYAYDLNSGTNLLAGKTYLYDWEDDSVAPEVIISDPVSYYNTSSPSIDINATISDVANRAKNAIFELYQYVNWQWGAQINYTPNMGLEEYGLWNATVDLGNFNEAHYYVKVWSEDEVGNMNNTEIIYFSYDKTAPVLTDAFAVTTSGNSGDIFELNFSGNDGVWDRSLDTVQFLLQSTDEDNNLTINANLDSVYINAMGGEIFEYWNSTWDSAGYPTGTYLFDVLINDSAGNSKEYENYFIITLMPSGVSAIDSYQNNTINITANTTETIDDSSNTGVSLNLITTDTVNDSSVSITSYNSNVENSTSGFGSVALGKYFSIVVSPEINGNLSSDTEIRFYYTDAEVEAAGIDETSLVLYKFNDSTSQWQVLNPSGVDTASNYIWGRVSSFSSFGVAGSAAIATSTTNNNGGGGGSSGTTIVKSGEIINVNILKDIITEAKMDKGAKIQFIFNNELHSIDVKDVDSELNLVTLEIESDLQIFNIQIGKTVFVDLDNDDVMDIEIRVKNIIGTKAYLEFKGLSNKFVEEEMISEGSVGSELQQNNEKPKGKNLFWLIFWIMFVILLISISIYISYKRNKRQQMGYW